MGGLQVSMALHASSRHYRFEIFLYGSAGQDGSSFMIAPYRAPSSPWKNAVRPDFFAGCCAPVEAARITSVTAPAAPHSPVFTAGTLTQRPKPISRDLLRTAPIRTFHIVKTFDTSYFPLTLLFFTITKDGRTSRFLYK